MGALRRPQHWEPAKPNPEGTAFAPPRVGPPYPRWLVVSVLILYCAVCWVLVVMAGAWGFDLLRTAAAQP